MSEPARRSQEAGNQLIEGVNAAESQTGTLEYDPGIPPTAQGLGPLAAGTVADLVDPTSVDASFSSSSDGSGPVRLIGEGETSQAMRAAEAAAGSLAADPDATVRAPQPGPAELLSTAGLPGVSGDASDTGGLSLSAASVGAALAATGAPLNMASVSSSDDSPDSTEPQAFVPDPSASPVSPPAGTPLGGPAAFGSPHRSARTPDTGAFVPREMVARRRAAEAMTRAIVMAPPLPPSMLTGSQPVLPNTPQQPMSGPITQPQTPGAADTQVDHGSGRTSRPGARGRKRSKGRKHGAHTAGIPIGDAGTQPTVPTHPAQQPPTGQMPAPGYAPQGYAPHGYPQQQTYAPQGYAPQGYQPGGMPVSAMGSVGVPTAPGQYQAPPPPLAPTRPGPSGPGRWAMLAAVVLVIGAIIVGVVLSNGDGDETTPNTTAGNTPSPSASAPEAAPAGPLDFSVSSFADNGSGIDAKSNGTYQSETYNSSTFAGLKKGVGLLIDLGSAKEVSEITITANDSPFTVGLRASDEMSASDVGVYETVVKQASQSGTVKLDGSSGGAHQYWLVYVTELPAGNKITVSDVKVTGPQG